MLQHAREIGMHCSDQIYIRICTKQCYHIFMGSCINAKVKSRQPLKVKVGDLLEAGARKEDV